MKKKRIKCSQEFCVSCGLCSVACSIAHTSDIDNILFLDKNYMLQPRNNVSKREAVSFMNSCRNCEEPECIKACVSGAIIKTSDRKINLDSKKCIGCWSCIMVCPNGAIMQAENEHGDKFSIKCDLCEGKESPACVEICPNKVLTIEEID
ncbi:4Fe-4S dicluster domain-containing protein [Candidatus Dependentiae bacterium]|nr:4Fe-4S dicluster domain-containing protein [Candidatus Dependentiae bacterium]